jgi:hypothetical protein
MYDSTRRELHDKWATLYTDVMYKYTHIFLVKYQNESYLNGLSN